MKSTDESGKFRVNLEIMGDDAIVGKTDFNNIPIRDVGYLREVFSNVIKLLMKEENIHILGYVSLPKEHTGPSLLHNTSPKVMDFLIRYAPKGSSVIAALGMQKIVPKNHRKYTFTANELTIQRDSFASFVLAGEKFLQNIRQILVAKIKELDPPLNLNLDDHLKV